jgi:hypothetical protein
MIKCATMGLIATLLLTAGAARAEEKEPSALIEIGGATEWDLRDGGQNFDPAVAIEITPLKNWLEIERGVSSLFGGGRADWNTDLVFKKPFTLCKTVEVEFGVGPEWLHTTGGGKQPIRLAARQWSNSSSGHGRIETTVGIWSRATDTISAAGTDNRLA